MKFKRLIAPAMAVTVMAIGLAGTPASALMCEFVGGNGNGNGNESEQVTEYSLTVSSTQACGVSGNDSEEALGEIEGVFEAPPAWNLAYKNDADDGDDFITATGFGDQEKSGEWTISRFPELTQIALVLKAGNNFAAFLLDPFNLSGDWTSSRGLSHASVYYRSCDEGDAGCGISAVPLPAAGWMLLAGIGGLVALRRRKSV